MDERFNYQNLSSELSDLNLHSASGEENETDSTRSSTMAQSCGPESTECVYLPSFGRNNSLSRSSGAESTFSAKAAPFVSGISRPQPRRPKSPEWVKAKPFVPGTSQSQSSHSESTEFANAAIRTPSSSRSSVDRLEPSTSANPAPSKLLPKSSSPGSINPEQKLCKYYWNEAYCIYKENCPYIHYQLCDICKIYCLVPGDQEQQSNHREICEQKMCGVCQENVETKCSISVFGLLENCNHKFCIKCIKKWKTTQQRYNSTANPTCPYCREPYNLVIPSRVWPDSPDIKKIIIDSHKEHLSKIECRFFNMGYCRFGNFCLYLHRRTPYPISPPYNRWEVPISFQFYVPVVTHYFTAQFIPQTYDMYQYHPLMQQ